MIDVKDFPTPLHPYLKNAEIEDTSGHSSARVYHLSTDAYLKIDQKGSLKQEALLTHYFYEQGLGVAVLEYVSEEKDYLLTQAADGQDATHFLDQPENLSRILARILKNLHSLKGENIPIKNNVKTYLAKAQSNFEQGCFYEKALLPIFQIKNREEAYELMKKNGHLLQENAFIHGDFCLPNIILKDGQFSCLIDVGLAGRSDRHIDLFWAIWSLNYNLGTDAYTEDFLDQYGRENVNWEILRTISAIEAFG